jgi:phosphate transport system permease protein
VAEQLNLLDGSEAEPRAAGRPREGKPHITATGFLIGRKTLVIGDSAGVVHTWFRAKPEGATTVDGALLVSAGRFEGPASPVTALSSSSRSRALAVGYADGSLRVVQVTSGNLIGSFDGGSQTPAGAGAIHAIAMAPKDNAVFTVSTGVSKWSISSGYPEVNFRTLLRPVWYEGYAAPAHVWQSSSGSDEFEPKLGLVPLVFGTVKATVYSIFFGAPLALLAAIYTSEFLHPRVRARLKPTIELMASLPSVVLGFLAAIVFAPLVENVVPEIITAAVALPFVLLLAAHVAQALPQRLAVRVRTARLVFAGTCLPLSLVVGFVLGPAVERTFFAGNFKLWLDGAVGDSAGAWAILVLPAAAFAVALGLQRLSDRVAGTAAGLAPASFLLARFLAGSVASLALAFAAGFALDLLGLDVRGGVVGTYVQRNAMIVGFVMGFAIIPIIYTISEDALSSVPEHLRAGSLALGATRWQTAVRIVVPTAMSGLFSALMIGLGRAVGETMIVLMAAGNTPLLDWNIFNGLRTLSANIAVELPEAVRNSTHYRTLFLAALVLFAMTFTLNTAAEMIRLRFRKRAYQL